MQNKDADHVTVKEPPVGSLKMQMCGQWAVMQGQEVGAKFEGQARFDPPSAFPNPVSWSSLH